MTESNDVESSITALKPKTRFKRWINQYINMIGNEPGLIYPCYNDNLTQAEISTIQEKASAYSSLYVELGSGSGRHLLQRASLNPKALFIGFELRFKRVFVTAKKAKTQNIQNILVIRLDAKKILEIFDRALIDGIYVNFPDPWDKKRWEKHRILTYKFLTKLTELLKIGGFVSHKTDHSARFDEALQVIENIPALSLVYESKTAPVESYNSMEIISEFEALFRSKGIPIHHLIAQRIC